MALEDIESRVHAATSSHYNIFSQENVAGEGFFGEPSDIRIQLLRAQLEKQVSRYTCPSLSRRPAPRSGCWDACGFYGDTSQTRSPGYSEPAVNPHLYLPGSGRRMPPRGLNTSGAGLMGRAVHQGGRNVDMGVSWPGSVDPWAAWVQQQRQTQTAAHGSGWGPGGHHIFGTDRTLRYNGQGAEQRMPASAAQAQALFEMMRM